MYQKFAIALCCVLIQVAASEVSDAQQVSSEVATVTKAKPKASLLDSIQGKWNIRWTNIGTGDSVDNRESRFWDALSKAKVLEIHDARIRSKIGKNRDSAIIVSKIDESELAHFLKRIEKDQTTVLLTFGDGNAGRLGIAKEDSGMTLRYPAGCCSRSGIVIHLEKQNGKASSKTKTSSASQTK